MAHFRFEATDASGRPQAGTLEARTPEEARQALTSRGLQVRLLAHGSAPAPLVPAVSRPAPAPQPAQIPRRVTRPVEQPTPVKVNVLTNPALDAISTRAGTHKANFLIFSQLSSYLRSGVNPVVALTEIGRRQQRKDYQDALQDVAKRAGEGGSMSAGLSRYPDLFSPDIVGTIRAGEVSGQLPEALQLVANTAESSSQIVNQMNWGKWLATGLIAAFPISMGVVTGALRSIKTQDESGGAVTANASLVQGLGQTMQLWGPVFAGAMLLLWAGARIWRMRRFQDLRHRLILGVPIFGTRAQAESLSRFAWAMGAASRAGLAPNEAYGLGAQAMPNRHMAAAMMAPLATATESTKSSELLRASGAVPLQYQDVVETGELVGDVPGALQSMAQAQANVFEETSSGVGRKAVYLIIPVLGILTGALAITLYKTWYEGIIRTLAP